MGFSIPSSTQVAHRGKVNLPFFLSGETGWYNFSGGKTTLCDVKELGDICMFWLARYCRMSYGVLPVLVHVGIRRREVVVPQLFPIVNISQVVKLYGVGASTAKGSVLCAPRALQSRECLQSFLSPLSPFSFASIDIPIFRPRCIFCL